MTQRRGAVVRGPGPVWPGFDSMTRALPAFGGWSATAESPAFAPASLVEAARRFREPVALVQDPASGAVGVGFGGQGVAGDPAATGAWPLLASLSPLYPEWLGDRSFTDTHGLRFPYVAGAMANGISTARLVAEMGAAGFLGFFGAAGLAYDRIVAGLDEIERLLPDPAMAWGANLIHSPTEPDLERAAADLFVKRGVKRVSASAFMKLTPSVVRYAAAACGSSPTAASTASTTSSPRSAGPRSPATSWSPRRIACWRPWSPKAP